MALFIDVGTYSYAVDLYMTFKHQSLTLSQFVHHHLVTVTLSHMTFTDHSSTN